jgi:hypothetical protein
MEARFFAPVWAACGLAMLAGCLHDPTEVVVVVDSDLTPFVDFDVIEIQLASLNSPAGFQQCATGSPSSLPITLGVTPQSTTDFTVTAAAIKGAPCLQKFGPGGPPGGPQTFAVASRKVSNVPFVTDERRALFVTLLRQCACQGTSCPHALEPACGDVTAPVLTDFDDGNIPHLPASSKVPAP